MTDAPVVVLADEVRDGMVDGPWGRGTVIVDRTYIGVTIRGPAVMLCFDGVEIIDCGIDGTAETFFIPVQPGRKLGGVICLVRVQFLGCHFDNVAVAATPDQIVAMLGGFRTA